MSLQAYLIFEIFVLVLVGFSKNVEAAYENNPFFQGGNKPIGDQTSTTNQTPSTKPPITVSTTQSTIQQLTIKEPTFTIEPPEILYGGNLNEKCLQPNGQFPSNACNKYVNCWNGLATEQTCSDNLLFNPVKLYCDYSGNVDCKGKPIIQYATPAPIAALLSAKESSISSILKPTQAVTSKSETSVVLGATPSLRKFCLKSTGLFRGSTCSTYVNCWDDNAMEQNCPTGLYFSSEGYCDYPKNVYCEDQDNNADNPAIVLGATQSLRKFCLRSTGLFPGSTCSKFVNCWNDNAVEQDCPTGLYFSSEGYCDYPENVYCAQQDNNVEIPATVLVKDNDCPMEFGNFRNKSNCSQYYTCAFYRVAARYDCPEGFSFSDLLGICDYSYRVDCSKDPQLYEKTANNIQGLHARDGNCPLEFGYFRNQTSCSDYYTCTFYKVTARYKCPEGFSFSDLLGVCDYSHRVDCSKKPQIYQKSTNNIQGYEFPFNAFAHPDLSVPAPGSGLCTLHNGLVRDQHNCSLYYVCEYGKVVESYVCPVGFQFSDELGVCDYERNVNCNRPPKAFEIGSSNMAIPNLPTGILSQVQKCVPGSVLRLNPNCTSAMRCRNGSAEIIQCSAGLAYDSKMDKCILAHLARC